MKRLKKRDKNYKVQVGRWCCVGFYNYEHALNLVLQLIWADPKNEFNAYISEV